MKTNYHKLSLIALAIAASAVTGCSKFLDVNDNPNAPGTVQESLVLPSSQAAIGMAVGNNMQVFGTFYAQYWTQNTTNSQYKSIDQYLSKPTDFDRMWSILYSDGLEDMQILTLSRNKQYAGIAYIEKAYTFQLLTDAFGDIPLDESLQGASKLSPQYVAQKTVYDSIFVWAERGIAYTREPAATSPANDDLIGGGDLDFWRRFGNTLLLKAYMRLSEVDPATAEAGVKKVFANGVGFLTVDGKIKYANAGGNFNPLFAEITGLGTQNLIASSTAVNALKNNNDPRISSFYLTRYPATGAIYGIPQGSYNTQPPSTALPAYPSPNTGGRGGSAAAPVAAAAPVRFITATESYFLQSEAVARGWATGDAYDLFKKGITASFAMFSVAGADTYIASAPDAVWPAGTEAQIKAIITQKYYAMCGLQGFEAWTEWRRTGYPNFLVVSAASELGDNSMPQRFLYPDVEVTRNNNFPGSKLITDKVWWDTK